MNSLIVHNRWSIVKKLSLSLLSGVLLTFSFPNFNFWLFAWFAFVPLFIAIRNTTKLKAFLISYFVGIIFWFGIIYWLVHVTFVGLLIFVAYLALYFGIFGLIISLTRPRVNTLTRLLFIPSIWVLLEYLRSHLFTGFGWSLLGYSQYLNLPMIQIANVGGVWCVSFLVMMVNVLIYLILDSRFSILGKKQRSLPIAPCSLAIFLLSLSLGYGFYKLSRMPLLKEVILRDPGVTQKQLQHSRHRATSSEQRVSSIEHRAPIKISVIQGNIPQAIKWEKVAKEKILKEYSYLSQLAAGDLPDLIIWPEAALPGILEEELELKEYIESFVQEVRIPFLVGAVSLEENNYYNSAILISQQGKFIQRYDKLHLVPFGEYIPLKKILAFLETIVPIGDFTKGDDYTVFLLNAKRYTLNAIRFSVLICFEDIFPEISRQFVKRGADFLVNITNDAWFGNTSSPYQHLSASVFRAVENGVYLVRAANTGISGFITPYGEPYPLINAGKQTFISGYKTKDIFVKPRQVSFYTSWGDWFIVLCLVIMISEAILRVASRE